MHTFQSSATHPIFGATRLVTGVLAATLAAVIALLVPAKPASADNRTAQAPPSPAVTASGAARSDYRFIVKDFHVDDSIVYPGWNGWQPQLDNSVCDMLTTEMSKQGRDMLERSRLSDVEGEQDLDNSNRVEPGSGAAIGHILGADYIILGSITEFGMQDQSVGGVGALGGMFGGFGYKNTTARVKIDYHVVNARTGRIVAGSANTAEGTQSDKGVTVAKNWYTGLSFSDSEWTSSQIGKATRKAVQQIADQLSTWNPNDGGAESDRTPVQASVAALISPTEFVIDKGKNDDVRAGDIFDIMRVSAIKNSSGKVVYQTQTRIGSATVIEAQDSGARLKVLSLNDVTTKVKEGDAVATPAPATTAAAH